MQGEIVPGDKASDNLLPVSLLCGFLGAGKTTLLKHVLEAKHSEEDFKCAVIVNDMATLNIDASLIDQSALVQTDPNKPQETKVVAMQNGCFCCTLQDDLVDQIKELESKKMFNYILLEASGVSEPSQIAPLFDLQDCDDQHDHGVVHAGPQLGEVARLDTCVTVIDAAEFYNNLGSMKHYEEKDEKGTIAELMMEQVEFSNVVVLNKTDLVSEDQQHDILGRISLLNPKAKVLKSYQSKINVMEILNTRLYSKSDMEENSVMAAATRVEAEEMAAPEETEKCCKKSLDDGKKKCCKSKAKDGQSVDSGLSQIILGVVKNDKSLTRHEARFGITSFVYRARRPFHPIRLMQDFLEKFFIFQNREDDDAKAAPNNIFAVQREMDELKKQQKDAVIKQDKRSCLMGELMRSKGHIWMATSYYFAGIWQQAGNVIRIKPARPWLVEIRHMWEGRPDLEAQCKKEICQENGEEWPHGDRCQELVFIGKDLNHGAIQNLLDKCLLDDEEMEWGPKLWQQMFWDDDKIRLPAKLFLDENVINVDHNLQNLEEYEDEEKIPTLVEDKNDTESSMVEFSAVSVAPQVATTFVYDP